MISSEACYYELEDSGEICFISYLFISDEESLRDLMNSVY